MKSSQHSSRACEVPATSRSDLSSPGICGSTRCNARPTEPTNSAPRTNFLTFDRPESCRRSHDPAHPSRQPIFGVARIVARSSPAGSSPVRPTQQQGEGQRRDKQERSTTDPVLNQANARPQKVAERDG
jgi:hypothetical protein